MEMEKKALGGDELFQVRLQATTHRDEMTDELEAIPHHTQGAA
jgi:hypothetical protein